MRHARSPRRAAGWGSSVAVLSAALLVVGLTGPAAPADAAPEDPANSAAETIEAAPTGGLAATEQSSGSDLSTTAATEGGAATADGDTVIEPPSAATAIVPSGQPSSDAATPTDSSTIEDEAAESAIEPSAENGAEPAIDPVTGSSSGESASTGSDRSVSTTVEAVSALPGPAAAPLATSWCSSTTGASGDFQQWNSESSTWTNGNAGKAYTEGDWVRQRVQLTDLAAANNQFVVTFGFQDDLTIGYDDVRFVRIADSDGNTIPGATGTVGVTGVVPSLTGQTATATATFNFTLPSAGDVWLYYDVHLASSLDYAGTGLRGAAYYAGSSLHVTRQSLNCIGLGKSALSIPARNLAYGTITVDKTTDPAGVTELFDFTVSDGENSSQFELADATQPWTSRVGTRDFTISEDDIRAPWSLTNLVCTGAEAVDYDLAAAQVVVTIVNGTNAFCTFTNSRSASLIVQKTWVDALAGDEGTLTISHGGEKSSATSTANGEPGSWTDMVQRASAAVVLGTEVTVSELLASGNAGSYEQDITCDGAQPDEEGSFTMPDHAVTCTITNDRLVPDLEVLKRGWAMPTFTQEIASGSPVVSGTTVFWTYEVTNTGETPLTGITVADDQVTNVSCPSTSLAVDASMTCTASGPVTALATTP